MKRILPILLCLGLIPRVSGQPGITTPSFPNSVGLFDLFEISFTLGNTYSNPYDPDTIQVYAVFYGPNDTIFKADAFYYEDYTFQKVTTGLDYYEKVSDSLNDVGWRIRFTPTIVGNWSFTITAEDIHGSVTIPNNGARRYHFVCSSVNEANGFISKANTRYLKRDVVKNGQRQFESYFPIGPNIAWYDSRDYGTYKQPRGIYQYERYFDSLDGRANYIRIWLSRYQALSLYGPEFTHYENGEPKVYFDSTINQKDSAELDWIIAYAAQHGIAIMPCVFISGSFDQNTVNPSKWKNNPFNTILGLENPCCFFTNADAKRITKNLLRYIVSRWGYATNIMAWEFWNEVEQMFCMCEGYKHIEQDVLEWHQEMYSYLHGCDPYNRCVSTSLGGLSNYPYLSSELFQIMDFVQLHKYEKQRSIRPFGIRL